MRGCDDRSGSLFSYIDLEKRIRQDHPLRTIHRLVDDALATMDHTFGDLYSALGRPSIPPERLLRAMLLQAFYSIRAERKYRGSSLRPMRGNDDRSGTGDPDTLPLRKLRTASEWPASPSGPWLGR